MSLYDIDVMDNSQLYTIPKIASMREVQRNYRQLFDWVEETKRPLVLISNAQIKVVVLALDVYNWLSSRKSKNSDLAPIYKSEYSKKRASKAIKGIRRLAKQGKDVNLSEFIIRDRENH